MSLPKQRATRPFDVVLVERLDDGSPVENRFSTHWEARDGGGRFYGVYDLTFEEAWADLVTRCRVELARPADVFEAEACS